MGLILLYHRVSELESDPQRLAVTPDRFSKHLEVIASHFTPVGLRPLVEHARRGTLPPRAVAVTFDDGYADNLENAKPLLERWNVPATLFVATSYVGGAREFWWDELERLLLTESALPEIVSLRVGNTMREWALGASAEYDSATRARHVAWHVERKDDPTPRHRLYRELCGLLRRCSPVARDHALRDLADQGRGTAAARSTHRVLNAEAVARLGNGTNVEIGAHSAGHPALSALTVDEQRHEIVSSKSAVEALTGYTPTAFAYPFGTADDYTKETVAEVRHAGFSCACVATAGRVGVKTDALLLPRRIVRDWEAEVFADRLREWQ
jgi:peptidoglycan/xylan/chitin deacetylase (PgdA/CDA1 family)